MDHQHTTKASITEYFEDYCMKSQKLNEYMLQSHKYESPKFEISGLSNDERIEFIFSAVQIIIDLNNSAMTFLAKIYEYECLHCIKNNPDIQSTINSIRELKKELKQIVKKNFKNFLSMSSKKDLPIAELIAIYMSN